MSVRGLESPADHDDELAADLLAELEVITTVTESIEPTLMKTDMVDRLRFQSVANKPFARIFERSEGLVGGARRLEVMYAVFCKQRAHDDDSEDSTIDSMRTKVTGVAEACLMNPIDRIALGEDYIQEILEDVSLEP